MTKGQKLVVMEHSVPTEGQKENVKTIKTLFAKLIDDVDAIENKDPRLKAQVITKLEDVCMYYVKLIFSEEVELGIRFNKPFST